MNFHDYHKYTDLIKARKIVEDPKMVENGEPYEVFRTWKERLFTRPWEPFRKTNVVVPKNPSSEIIIFKDKIVCHPSIAKALRNMNNIWEL